MSTKECVAKLDTLFETVFLVIPKNTDMSKPFHHVNFQPLLEISKSWTKELKELCAWNIKIACKTCQGICISVF